MEETPEACFHDCTSMCRHNGCNCTCGEFHQTPPADRPRAITADQEKIIAAAEKEMPAEA